MTDPAAPVRNPARVRDVAVPPAARALSTISRTDYENALLADIDPAQERTAEQWARTVLEDATAEMRRDLADGWSELGMRLASGRSDRHVLGWPVLHSTANTVLLGAASARGLHGELLFERRQDTLLFASFIQLDTDDVRAMWAALEDVHPQVMRQLLEQAIDRVAA